MSEDRIYMDNAAATRCDPEVVRAMMPYFTDIYAVASSEFSHTPGIQAKEALEAARQFVADRLKAAPEEIIFTSGGTEANNLAVKGGVWTGRKEKDHIVCSRIEYNSVLQSCQWLEKEGFRVTWLDVNDEGFVDMDQLRDSLTEKTALVSIQHANQETGTVQPVQEIASLCHDQGILFHTDAALSFTHLDLGTDDTPVDLITLSSHKIHGPKGIGALYVRKGTRLHKWIHGGYHEFNLRGGTENVAGAVGFGEAVRMAGSSHTGHIRMLQKKLLKSLENDIDDVVINGPRDLSRRLPSNVNVSFDLVEGESVVLHLDMRGISVITGSACFSRSLEPSYVMMAMGYSHERAHGSIRFTLSRFNTADEVDRVVRACGEVVDSLRKISPLKKGVKT